MIPGSQQKDGAEFYWLWNTVSFKNNAMAFFTSFII